jgi:glutathione-regulated potassium-efflux system ancillary protein KefF
MICVIHAHPYPHRSRINRVLVNAVAALPDVELRSLYELYPDFDIDVAAEQSALQHASLVVWMHPLYWYSVPALLKHWFDKVLAFGFGYGQSGHSLQGKHCLWVPTTGGYAEDFAPDGFHGRPFDDFVPVIEQTARFCGMQWEPPYVVYGATAIAEAQLDEQANAFRRHIVQWREAHAAGGTQS